METMLAVLVALVLQDLIRPTIAVVLDVLVERDKRRSLAKYHGWSGSSSRAWRTKRALGL